MSKAEDMSTQAKPTAPLRTKSYFAPSIQAAIAIARTELGEDLLLVSSQSTVGQDRQFGDFQVVFASGDEAVSPPDEESASQDSLRPAPQSFQDVLSAMLPAATAPAGTKEEKLTHIHLCLADLSISLPDSERVMVASPCSGHGFKHSAAIGEALADWATKGESRHDLSAFGLARFGGR